MMKVVSFLIKILKYKVLSFLVSNFDILADSLQLNQDTLVIDYYHPAVHYPNRVNYYALMAICDVARKKYGI